MATARTPDVRRALMLPAKSRRETRGKTPIAGSQGALHAPERLPCLLSIGANSKPLHVHARPAVRMSDGLARRTSTGLASRHAATPRARIMPIPVRGQLPIQRM
jgi:hypothetical protein